MCNVRSINLLIVGLFALLAVGVLTDSCCAEIDPETIVGMPTT